MEPADQPSAASQGEVGCINQSINQSVNQSIELLFVTALIHARNMRGEERQHGNSECPIRVVRTINGNGQGVMLFAQADHALGSRCNGQVNEGKAWVRTATVRSVLKAEGELRPSRICISSSKTEVYKWQSGTVYLPCGGT